MDALISKKAEILAKSIAGQASTIEELKGVMRSPMKSASEQMLG